MNEIWQQFIYSMTNGNTDHKIPVFVLLSLSVYAIYNLKGRVWAILYVSLIPFLNWSFGFVSEFVIMDKNVFFTKGVSVNPMTVVTGLVFVVRDFAQREMGHRILVCMAIAIGWSFFYAWPVIALASGIAFAVSEAFDWLLFTFTKYRLSTRIVLSSAVAAPVDTSIFLYGADLAKQINLGLEPGNTLHLANWVVFIVGKMIGAFVVATFIRKRERMAETADCHLP